MDEGYGVQRTQCMTCGVPIDATAQGPPYESVRGYRRHRHGGGANQITMPDSSGAVMCPSCVAVLKVELKKGRGTIPYEPIDGCHICRGELGNDSYEEVMCLRRRRVDGGANQAIAAQPTGKRACSTCIDAMRKHTPLGQQSLI